MSQRLREIIQSYNVNAPLEEASTIPSSWYVNPEVAKLERQTVFSRSWQVAARLDQLQDPGSYVTCTIAGEPIVVVRGEDNIPRAFFNVCRHHAAAVMTAESGQATQLRCPYHGWTYSLEGDLKAAPDLGAICNFDRNAMGLVPIRSIEWKDWVWVSLATSRPPTFEEIPDLQISHLHWFERRRYQVDCNWKVFVDNYLDGGYHVPHLHRGLDSVLDYSEYQIELGDRYCLQWSPLRPAGRALYYWFYPNFMVNLYPDAMDTNLVVPVGIDRTEVIFDFHFTDMSEQSREQNLARIALSEKIQDEDVDICRLVQRGLESRSYTSGRLSVRREAGEHLFHRLLHSDLVSGL
jgi:choline monooxygenase